MYSETAGGNGGSPFNDAMLLFGLPSHCDMRVEEVQVRFGGRIDQLRIKIGNGKNSYWSDIHGGNGGSGPHSFLVPPGENIVTVLMRSGSRVDSLQFITDRGTVSQQFGGNGGSLRSYHLPGRLIGFFGKKGSEIDQLGFISMKEGGPGPVVG